jgi:transposase
MESYSKSPPFKALERVGRARACFQTSCSLDKSDRVAALAPKSICAVKGTALPLTFIITPGQRNEATVLEQLMEQGAVKRKGRGRPRLRPKRVVGDKAYTGRRIRGYLRGRGICLTIPRLFVEPRRGQFDRTIYRQRNCVERMINRLKQFRRIATRY